MIDPEELGEDDWDFVPFFDEEVVISDEHVDNPVDKDQDQE